MLDLLLVTLPPVGTFGPLLGPALVYSAVKKAGFNVKQVDFNLNFFLKNIEVDGVVEWLNSDSYSANESGFIDGYIEAAFDDWIKEIISLKPRWIGLSVFTVRSRIVLFKFLPKLKAAYPEGKIVVGGSGIINSKFYERRIKEGVLDAYVMGEGEEAIIEVLNGNLNAPNVNGNPPKEIKSLDGLAIADYEGLNLENYGLLGLGGDRRSQQSRKKVFFVEGSRGCVRKCSFCDIPFIKPGYRYRSTKSLMSEITHLVKTHGAKQIYFVDSLINGSLKNLKELCQEFLILKKDHPRLAWEGYFIIRGPSFFSPESFDLLAASGAFKIKLGIESGSDNVRRTMNKIIPDSDIDYNLNQCFRVGIGVEALLMVGFPSETREDFEMTLDFIKRNKETLARPRSALSVSWKVGIKEHESDMSHNLSKYGITYDTNHEWFSDRVNILVTSKRYFEVCELARACGIKIRNKHSRHRVLDKVAEYGATETDLLLEESILTEKYMAYINKNKLLSP